jgi:hypothetical protein
MKFDMDFLEEEALVVYDRIVGHERWAVLHEKVFRHEGKFYRWEYRRAATEYQENEQREQFYCEEVHPVVVPATIYMTRTEIGCPPKSRHKWGFVVTQEEKPK